MLYEKNPVFSLEKERFLTIFLITANEMKFKYSLLTFRLSSL